MTIYVNNVDVLDGTFGHTITSLATNDAVYVLRNVSVVQTNGGRAIAMFGSNITVTVEGMVSGDTGGIVDTSALLSSNRVFIASTGLVTATTYSAVALLGGSSSLTNAGTIRSYLTAVRFNGDRSEVINTGAISSSQEGIEVTGVQNRIDNAGSITAGTGVLLEGTGTQLVNSGTISGGTCVQVILADVTIENTTTGRMSAGSTFTNYAPAINVNQASAFHLTNAGLVDSMNGPALQIISSFKPTLSDVTTVAEVHNSGTISTMQDRAIVLVPFSAGPTTSYQSELHLTNTGLIVGDIVLIGGNDIYYGDGGRLDGTLLAGAGSDSLTGGDARDRLLGEAGADAIEGGRGRDSLDGGSEDDTIEGGEGADALAGGLGLDTLVYTNSGAGVVVDLDSGEASGGEATGDTISGFERVLGSHFDDQLFGAATGDMLDGAVGNDLLVGQGGGDQLVGRRGADTLVGGAGADTMSGGGGADLFLYLGGNESGPGAGARDRITDFRPVEGDRISLLAIDADDVTPGDQAFTFIGTAAFTGAGQLRYAPGSTTLIEANINADAAADIRITLGGNYALTAEVFIL